MKHLFLSFICFIFIAFRTNAIELSNNQNDTTGEVKSSLIIGTDYATNTNNFGRFDNYSSQPSLSPSVSYFNKHGITLGGVSYFIANSDASATETTSELDLQASYTWNLGSVLSLIPAYTHYFYSDNSSTLKKSYSDYLQLGINSDVNWWNTNLTGKYLWGDFDEMLLTLQTSAAITFDNFLHKGNSFVIQPTAEMNVSNIDYYRYISGNYKFLRAYASKYPDATVDDLLSDINANTRPVVQKIIEKIQAYPYIQRRLNRLSVDGDLVISDLFSNNKEFRLSNIGFTLPFYYYVGNFCFTVGCSAFKPFNQPKVFGNDWTTYFTVGFNYTFN